MDRAAAFARTAATLPAPVIMRIRRAIWTFLTGQASAIVTLLVALAATPLLLRWLGDDRLGAVEATTQWIGYISLLEFGVGGALMPLMAAALTERDDSRVQNLLVAAMRAYLGVSGLMLLAGIALVAVITTVLPVRPELSFDLRLACAISLLGLLFVPLSPLRTLFEAGQRGYVVNIALLSQSLLITGTSLLFAWASLGISGQFLAVLCGGLAFNSMMVWCAKDRIPALSVLFDKSIRRSSEWHEIWHLNWPSFAFNLCGRVGLVTDNIIIGGLLSPALVVPFFLTQQLAVLVQRQLQGIGNASWAGLAELHVHGDSSLFNQRLIELTRLIGVLGVAALIPIMAFDRTFIALWIGEERYGGDWLIVLAALNAFLLAIFSLWAWCINGTGRVRMIMPGMLVQTGINLMFSIVLTIEWGLIGPVLGTTLGFFAVSVWYLPLLLKRCFATSPAALLKAAVWPMLSAIPFGIGVWFVALAFPAHGWLEMAVEMSLAAVSYLAVWWLVGLSAREKDLWLQRFSLLIPRESY
jgi:O-antigen/teichoic acid export membrane protein